ncbi:MAG: site-specific DNA-methyltransferase [Chloroflexota bacterium]|nr:site-specific DNA-methyltransferase [Chloroflexota bacterium]
MLDPFLGSGTTSVVAYRLGRPSYGYDLSTQYIADARARLQHEAELANDPEFARFYR